ncbi:NAD-dependent epimerase/dehydratase family protein [Algoriphagus halophytocola]|uniref:NAD-dependent epimerase/dehydratase family protein n=1 Tax=Algoriphagus halophytocola TaxID=2991499 RepID=A0ABY6ME63_9BACT|nr:MULTISPECIES: NAD-dependent epimerase/dehydratase family protein [unclassified Algoriphagus]UZD22092.1 NAD-dependent epimerase/dehydratase family protein [Algoriphagus sp. TR-M5]WBL43343.1 NAD-dependent epimerase/dehydratase family protein [Algoriphagus sp. TR-M9]
MRIALISGGSGLVGKAILHQLFKNEDYDYVLSVGRRKLAIKQQKLVQIEGDMAKLLNWDWEEKVRAQSLGGEHNSLLEALAEKTAEVHAFSALGTTIKQAGSKEKFYAIDHDLVIEFAKWAKSLNASKFLYVSASGADANSSIFYSQTKGKTESDLKSVGFDYLGLFRPSLLLGNRHEFRLGEQVATILMKPLVWLKLFKNIRPIYDYQVAKALVKTALAQKSNSVEVISSGEMQDLSK